MEYNKNNYINAHCKICGTGYHVCNSCMEQQSFKPWRSITDSIEHYKIYLAIHGYTITKDKLMAKEELEKCDLSGCDNFIPEIKSVIQEIMTEEKRIKPVSRVKKSANKTVSIDSNE